MEVEVIKVNLGLTKKELCVIKHALGNKISVLKDKVISCNAKGDIEKTKFYASDLISTKKLYKEVRDCLDVFYGRDEINESNYRRLQNSN